MFREADTRASMLVLTLLRLVPLTAVIFIVCWVGLRVRGDGIAGLRTLPESRYAPLLAALVMSVVVWYEWGSLHQIPIVHDEASYLLQAETLARWRWTMPSPPMPEFFEQFHVLVTPAYASKYPPGHGLLLVPGIWFGLPGLVPVVLCGLAAALLFIVVRRVTNGWIATLTFALWLPLRGNLWFRPSYFSEDTTSVLWLLGWWALLEWCETGRERWLALVAACTAWIAITRPLTAVAFALPIVGVVLWRLAQQRNWARVARPAIAAVAIVCVLPLWSAKTTHDWRELPDALYSKIYFPFDAVGFGLDTTPPERALPPDMQNLVKAFGRTHAAHTVDRLPETLYERWRAMFDDAFGGLRAAFAAFAIIGLITLSGAGWFAVAGSLTLTLCYLVYAHPPGWDLYYLEIFALLPFLTACGVWACWIKLGKRGGAGQTLLRTVTPQAALAGLLLVLLLIVPARADIVRMHREQIGRRAYQSAFARKVAALPDPQTIIFIRYTPRHDFNSSLIANHADLANARTWLVYDRGAEDAKLAALAPNRVAYLYDEASGKLTRLAP